jgi:hypothetical protein
MFELKYVWDFHVCSCDLQSFATNTFSFDSVFLLNGIIDDWPNRYVGRQEQKELG